MRCFLRKMLVFLPLIGLAAQPTVPKSGGLCFRFDDNQTVPKWKDMAEVFRRNNCRFSMSIISHWIHSPEFSALLRNLQKEGHEIMDHTASHAVFTLPARTPEERREFESSPDFDHWNGDKACFRGIPDKSKFSRPIRAVFSGNRVEGLPADREKEWKQTSFLYVPALKKAFLYSRKGKELHLRSFWNEDNVRFPERKELEFHLVPFRGGFLASDALLRLQAKVSAENFRRAGIRRPVTWIQPGGYEPVLTAENVRKVYEPLGYLGGATYPDSARKVYHEPDPERCRFAMMWGDFSLEKKDLAQLKTEIANRIARHQVLIGGEGQRPGAVLLPEGLQVCPLVALHRDEIVVALLVVPDEEVLGVGLRVGQWDLRHLRHVVYRLVLRHLMPDVSLVQKGVNLLLVHICVLLWYNPVFHQREFFCAGLKEIHWIAQALPGLSDLMMYML